MEKITIIVLASLGVVVLAIVLFGVRSTTKTIDSTLQKAKHEIYNDSSKYNHSKVMIGGSRSKLMTTTNAFLLFAGLFIGYILSHFSF